MKNLISAFVVFCSIIVCSSSNAQISRRNTKSSVPYRSTYQRMGYGSVAEHSLEIRGGSLWGWGMNTSGQIGDGTTGIQRSPVKVGTDNSWVNVSVGGAFSVGLKADGTLWTWGENNNGQLGDGTSNDRIVPGQVGTDANWIAISAGNRYALAIKSDGTLWAWGFNNHGELGIGSNENSYVPVQVGTDTKWVAISAGANHSVALKSDGTLWAWGWNSFSGQVGDGTLLDRNSPVQLGSDRNWAQISAGNNHTLAIKSDGTLWGWGWNSKSQLGIGNTIDQASPVQIGTDRTWIRASAGWRHSMGLKANGTLWVWGSNTTGQLGDGTTTDRPVITQIGTDNNWVSIVASSQTSMASKADGTLYTWGYNDFGNVGDGTTITRTSPVLISTVNHWVSLAPGQFHTIGLKSDGTLWAWGKNNVGQLADGTTTDKTNPLQIGTGNQWISVASGINFSIALKSDGTLWSWGYNGLGQLGDGTITTRTLPTQIGTDNKWTSISAGVGHCLALKSDGTIWGWGGNGNGEVGDGTGVQRRTPVQLGTDTKWVSVQAGNSYSLAMKSDGTVWACGVTGFAGSLSIYFDLTQVGTANDWVGIAAGDEHSHGIKSDGTLWAWGKNAYGQLGDGTSTNNFTPFMTSSLKTWISAVAGSYHSLCLKADGSFWTWGRNNFGQLGDGSSTNRSTPTRLGTANNWLNPDAGAFYSMNMKADRELFCSAGNNASGQLGDRTLVNRSSFVCNTNCLTPAPVNTTTSGAMSVCNGTSTQLSATGVGKVSWYSAASGGIFLGTGSSYSTPVMTLSTTFYVQDSTCLQPPVRIPVIVTVNPLPVLTAVTPLQGAISSNLVLTGSNLSNVTTIRFNNVSSIFTINSSTQITVVVPNGATSGNVIVITNSGCSDTLSGFQVVNQTCATPTANPAGGTFGPAQTVTLSCATPGVSIYYSTNGILPSPGNAASRLYTGPLLINLASVNLKARAYKDGFIQSAPLNAVYNITNICGPVTITPATGNYAGSQLVTMSCPTPGATIYYSASGNVPSPGTTFTYVYSGPFFISKTASLRAFATKTDFVQGPTALSNLTVTSLGNLGAVSFSPVGGTYANAQTVSLSTTEPGTTIYYTTSGNTPMPGTGFTQVYSGPISVFTSMSIKAFAYKAGFVNGPVVTANYVITNPAIVANPVFTPGAGAITFPQAITISCATAGAQIWYTTTGNTPDPASPISRLYSTPIVLNGATGLKAKAFLTGFQASAVVTAIYTGAGARMATENTKDENRLVAYPNPTSGRFTLLGMPLDGQNAIKVWNSSGQLLLTENPETDQPQIDLDLSAFPSGLYLVELQSQKGERLHIRVFKD